MSGRQTPVVSQYCPAVQGLAVLQPPVHFVVSAHWFDEQPIVVAVVQVPAPLQVVAVVALPLVQVAAAHCTELPGNTQDVALVPSQEA